MWMRLQFPEDGSHFNETSFSKCGFIFTSIEDDNLMMAVSFWDQFYKTSYGRNWRIFVIR